MAYSHSHYRSQFGDTTLTKVFVGGLAWETPTEELRTYFHQFGDILEAVIITDKNTSKSKGYGFVTFRDAESARRACVNPNPVIDGRRANCNIAALGRPRPSPPRGRGQQSGVNPYQGSTLQAVPPYSGVPPPLNQPPLPPPLPPPVVYSPYGYPTYSPDYGYHHHHHHQAVYNSQVQQAQLYQQSPYFYGYSVQQSPRGTFPNPSQSHHHHQRIVPPSYLYYPTPAPAAATPQFEGASSFNYPPPPPLIRHRFPSTDSQTSQQTPTEAEVSTGAVTIESPTTI